MCRKHTIYIDTAATQREMQTVSALAMLFQFRQLNSRRQGQPRDQQRDASEGYALRHCMYVECVLCLTLGIPLPINLAGGCRFPLSSLLSHIPPQRSLHPSTFYCGLVRVICFTTWSLRQGDSWDQDEVQSIPPSSVEAYPSELSIFVSWLEVNKSANTNITQRLKANGSCFTLLTLY